MDCHNCGKKGHVTCRNNKSKEKGSKTENKKDSQNTRRKDMFIQLNMERRGTFYYRKCLLQ